MSKHARRTRGWQLQAGNAMRRLWFVVLLCSLAFPRWASANDIAPGGTLRAVYLGSNPAQAVRDRATGAIRGASADLARELVPFDLAAIATASTPPALAAKAATITIRIVIMDPGGPVSAGLVASLARPGGNVTGISSMAPELAAKRLEILKDVAPEAGRIGMLCNAAIAPAEVALKEMAEAAAQLRVVLRAVPIRATGMAARAASAPGFDEALQTIARTWIRSRQMFV